MKKFDYGKYKGVIISIALFLLLDASVLILNFYISFEISADAEGVNIAGRQRMLSQRMMKSLLDIQTSQEIPSERERAIKELRFTTTLFSDTFTAFDTGGNTRSATGNAIFLEAVNTTDSRAAIENAKQIWLPYQKKIDILLGDGALNNNRLFEQSLTDTIAYGRSNNLELLKLMNDLTVALEQKASSKADTLRMIQTIGITLAVINFLIITFHFIRQLRESDARIDSARKETQEILDTVNEGLFLLDRDLRIGDQHSKALNDIFSRRDIGGKSFNNLLKSIISEKDMQTANDFVDLLFKPNVKEKLIGSLNPLNQLEIHIPTGDGGYESKYVNFAFSRVVNNKEITHVLVTVTDISKQMELAKELELAKSQSAQQLEMLSAILQSNAELLPMFLRNSEKTFTTINETLREPVKSHGQYLEKANRIYALIHNFKGESSALNLDQFADLAHQFEDEIDSLRQKNQLGGKDFLRLTVLLDQLMSLTDAVEALSDKLRHFSASAVKQAANDASGEVSRFDWSHLDHLASEVAERQGKEVELITSGLNDHAFDSDFQQAVSNITVQLIRNAITHGIESPVERRSSQKASTGEIHVRLTKRAAGNYQLIIQDDGEGLNTDKILNSALESGLVKADAVEGFDRKKIISLIFSPELSTHGTTDKDAGRGIGMHAVREAVRDLGGKIGINSQTGKGCTFTITIPDPNRKLIAA